MSPTRAPTAVLNGEVIGGLPIEAFSMVHELFDDVDWDERSDDAAFWLLRQISSNYLHENIERLIYSDARDLSRLRSTSASPSYSDEEQEDSATSDSFGSVDQEKSQHGDSGSAQSENLLSDPSSQFSDLPGRAIFPTANSLSHQLKLLISNKFHKNRSHAVRFLIF